MQAFHRTLRPVLPLLLASGLLPGAAQAHDSWLRPVEGGAAGRLELVTGNRYPVQEYAVAPDSLRQARCTDGAAPAGVALRPGPVRADRLPLAARAGAAPLLACWVEIAPADIEIEPPLVEVYFDEIRASASDRAAWAALRAQGQPWRETYRKFARIELPAATGAPPAALAAARRPVGLGLELVVLGERPIVRGEAVEFQLLRDGEPVPGFPLELVSERSPLGVWRTTDAQGRLVHTVPFNGQWLLRGTQLTQPAEAAQPRWHSRFVTLVFHVR